MLETTNQAFVGGDSATRLSERLQAEARGETGSTQRWRESKGGKKNPNARPR